MQGTKTWIWASLTLAVFSAAGCSDTAKHGRQHPDAGAIGGIVEGLVQDTNGEGVPNATVSIGTQKATTDKNGIFRVENVEEGTVQVAVDDKHLSKAQTETKVGSSERSTVALTTDTMTVVAMDNAEKGGVAIDKGGVRVEISENSLKKSDGSLAKGTVEVHYTVVSVPQKAAAAPGGMKAVDADKPVQLAPSGLIDVRFYQGDERLTFVGEADLRFPLGPNKYKDRDSVSIWSFDEVAGRWRREGRGSVVRTSDTEPAIVRTTARHFTWWAAAEPIEDSTCVRGQLRDAEGEPAANAHVAMRGQDSLLYVEERSGADGSFCLPAPQGAAVEVWALASGDEFITWSWETALESEAAQCGGACTVLPNRAPAPLDLHGGDEPTVDAGDEPTVDAGDQPALDGSSDGSISPEPDAGADPGLDASTEPALDAGVDPQLDASVDPQPDASVVSDADAGSDAGQDAGGGSDDGTGGTGEPEICDNEIDDDADGRTDCADPACADAVRCSGIWFNGVNTYMDANSIYSTAVMEGTVELWFRPESLVGAATLVDLSACGTHRIDLETDGTIVASMGGCSPGATVTSVTATAVAEVGSWVHVAHVWSTTSHALIVNGVEVDQISHSISAIDVAGLGLFVGGMRPSGRRYHGAIDELRVWSVVRSAEELALHSTQSIAVDTPELLGYWQFNEAEGSVAYNAVDVTLSGVLYGSYTWFSPLAGTE